MRIERAALLRLLTSPPPGVLPVNDVCDCSFATPFVPGRPLWDLGLGPDGGRLQPPAERNTPWDLRQLSGVLADLAAALADLHDVGIAHGDAALMNALVVDSAGAPKGM